jgi:glycosyltransferase involved in cell wall biosynthesis
VIVDTGSSDGTVSVARSFGAKVLFHKWEEDFSIARNISLDNAKGDWILMLDADEALAEQSKNKIKKIIYEKDIMGCSVIIQMHPQWITMRNVRLFKNLPEFRYTGVFHEELTISDKLYSRFIPSDIRIIHKPLSKKDFKRKYARNVKLLKKHIHLYPEDIYQVLDLIRLYLDIGKLSEAEKLLDRVLFLISQSGQEDRNYKFYQAYYFLYKLQLFTKKNIDLKDRLYLCEKVSSVLPLFPIFLYEAAKISYLLKSFDKSIDYFKKCLNLGENKSFDPIIIFPKNIMGEKSLAGLGYCYFKKRNYRNAEKYFSKSHMLKRDDNIRVMLYASRYLAEKENMKKNPAASYLL